MNAATAAYVALGGLAGSLVLSLAMGRLLRRLRVEREAVGEHDELSPQALDRLWAEIAAEHNGTDSGRRIDELLASLSCRPVMPCRMHDVDTCRLAGPCCPTCPSNPPA